MSQKQQQVSLHVEDATVQELLHYTALFGPRYRFWRAGQAYTPSDLLAHLLQQKAHLLQQKVYALWEAEVEVKGKKVFAWSMLLETPGKSTWPSSEPSSYFIEDMLNIERVFEWLRQRPPLEQVAVLLPGAEKSTFLTTYYQDMLGVVPEHLDEAHLPVWCISLEALVYSLNPNEHRDMPITVCAATLAWWMNLIGSIFEDGRLNNFELDDDASALIDV